MKKIRTCVSCRKKGERNSLLRFIRTLDGEIKFDREAILPSRGAWLCPKRDCLNKAFLKALLFKGKACLKVDNDKMFLYVGRVL